ncbi:MAG: TolC family protein [Prevotellaceae bacterium]|jgi:outer membrane protein|nr:TolC family protein [Prevotellaceae bacterium]
MKRVAVFLSLAALPAALYAQKKWTLNECIDYATKNSLNVKTSQLTIQSNRILADKSRLSYVPDLTLYSDYRLNTNRSLAPLTYSFIENTHNHAADVGINLGANLFDGLRKYYAYHKSLSDWEASMADFEALKNDLSLSVLLSYMNILLSKEIISSVKQQLENSEQHIGQAKRLLQEGVITAEKLQNLQIQRDNEKYALADAEGNLVSAIINLCSLLNIADYQTFDIEDEYSFRSVEMIPLKDIIASAMSLPQVQAGKIKIRSAEYGLKVARSDLYPTLSFGAFFGSSYSDLRKRVLPDANGNPLIAGNEYLYDGYPFFNQLNNHRSAYLSLTAGYPILNLFQTKKNIALAKHNILNAQYELQAIEKKLTEHIAQTYAEVETARKKYEASLSASEHARAILSYAVNKLTNGVLTPSDYTVTKNNLMVAEAQASRAKYEYFFKLELLMFYYSQANAM